MAGANAKLIAAAPDLKNELQNLIDLLVDTQQEISKEVAYAMVNASSLLQKI